MRHDQSGSDGHEVEPAEEPVGEWDEIEDALDRAALRLARVEGVYLPWAQVKAELGLE